MGAENKSQLGQEPTLCSSGSICNTQSKCGCWSSKAYTLVADGDGGGDNAKSLTEKRGGHRR